MIDTFLRWAAARFWRSRISRNMQRREETWAAELLEWKREHPDRCMYCGYTIWAIREHGVKLKLEPHHCVEGNSPRHPLPRAKVIA